MAPREEIFRIFVALSAANEAILRSTCEDELYERVCDAVVGEGKFFGAAALLVDANSLLQIVAGAGARVDSLRARKLSVEPTSEFGQGLSATAFRTGLPAITNDYWNDGHRAHLRDEAKRDGTRSAAAVPIKKDGSSIGVLLFWIDKPDALDEESEHLLHRMADNVSFALDNFEREKQRRLADEANERLGRMFAALSQTNEAIMRAKTRKELCEIVCEAAVLGGTFVCTMIKFLEPDNPFLLIVAAAGSAKHNVLGIRIPIDLSHPEERSINETAFKTKEACIINDYFGSSRFPLFRDLYRSSGTRSAAAFPLIKDGESIGLLSFFSSEIGTFTPEMNALLQRLADNVSFAWANFDRAEEKAQADERISYLATHDGLTGLPNRVMFSQLLNGSIETARRHDRQFALLFIDLDGFKHINDTLGHAEGDALLVEMGKRFRSCVRASDVVARLGGDEFVVILQEVSDRQQVSEASRKLLAASMEPVLLGGRECCVTASIGAAMFPGDGADEQTLIKNADIAMYLAKDEGKNDLRFYSTEMKAPPGERLGLEVSLRHALERNELVVYYQPKRDLRTGLVTGVEALLRWQHPDFGLLLPDRFIPLAEQTGLIIPIGVWVLKTACRQNMEWQSQGFPPMSMAVNLSPRQFTHIGLLASIDQVLEETGMAPESLQLEVTEDLVMQDVERAVEVLDALKIRGVQLAISDFGAGYSSMSFIKRFPVNTLKIDRSFVRDLSQDAGDKAIADAIIGLGRALGVTVVAEGVETVEQETFLRERSCDQMQGFLFSKAIPPEDIERLLRFPVLDSPALQPSREETLPANNRALRA